MTPRFPHPTRHVWRIQRHYAVRSATRLSRVLACGAVLALAGLLPAGALAATRTITCHGGARACTATLKLRGTHANDHLVIRLTDTDLALRAITPTKGAGARYGLGSLSMRLGGSELTAVLLRFGTATRTDAVTFSFAVPPPMRACGTVPVDTGAGTTVTITAVQAHGVTCTAARAAARGCVTATGTSHWTQIFQVDDTITLNNASRRVTFAVPGGGATCVPAG